MKLSKELIDGIKAYRESTPWYAQWSLYRHTLFAAIPAIVIALAVALGITIGEAIAILCTDGSMPAAFRWLCF